MSKLLSEWSPSEATLDLLRLNGLDDAHIENAVTYLKTQTELEDIDKIDGYDSWNAFFIMFAIKAAGSPHKHD
jgi:hypothetical protein